MPIEIKIFPTENAIFQLTNIFKVKKQKKNELKNVKTLPIVS